MAAASLLIRIAADIGNLKGGVDRAVSELDRLKSGASDVGNRMLGMLPPAVATQAKSLAGSVGGLAGAFGGLQGAVAGLGLGYVVNDFLRTTGSLSDLSEQTDVTIRDLQRFQFAGSLVGVSLDQITGAVGQLQNRLGSGDRSAFAALDHLGLTLQQLQRLDPGQQFEVIASAISRIPDPSRRAAVAMDLFGRTGVTLMPLLRSDMKKVGDQAHILSDETVAAGDAFGDLLTRGMNLGKAAIGTVVLGPIVKGAEEVSRAFQDAVGWLDALRQRTDKTLPQVGRALGFGATRGAPDITMSMADADKLAADLDRQVKAQHDAAAKAASGVREIWAREVKNISDAISGATVLRDVKQWAEALRTSGAAARVLADEGLRTQLGTALDTIALKFGSLKAAGVGSLDGIHAALRSVKATAETIPPALATSMGAFSLASISTRDFAADNARTTETLMRMVDAGQMFKAQTLDTGKVLAYTTGRTVTWREELTGLSQSMTNLAQTTGSGFVSALASITNAFDVSSKGLDRFKGGFDQLTSGGGLKSILGGLSGIVGGIGGIAAAAQVAIGLGKALFNVFDRNKGRDAVKEFAESFGGFDALHARLNLLGDEGERLWIALTQGVGRNNPGQAARAIAEIEEALKGLTTTIRTGVGNVLDEFEGRGITIPVKFDVEDFDGRVPAFASGGIVRQPTLALIGEAGPEAVVPLGQMGNIRGGSDGATVAELQGMRSDLRRLPDVMFRAMRDAQMLRA